MKSRYPSAWYLAFATMLIVSVVVAGCGTSATATAVPAATQAVAPTAASAATQAVAPTVASAATQPLWVKRFDGQTLTIAACGGVEDGVRELAPEFEKATGAKIELVVVPYDDCHQKYKIALAAGDSGYDAMILTDQWLGDLVQTKNLEDLGKWISDPAMTPPDWDFADFIPSTVLDGRYPHTDSSTLYALPILANQQLLFIRSDLFKEAGIVDANGNPKPPATWDEYLADAQKLNNPGKGVYGNILMAKQGVQIACHYYGILLTDGLRFWDDAFKPTVNTPEGIEAGKLLMNMLNYADPAAVVWDWAEAEAAMEAGHGAMQLQWSSSIYYYENPKNSQVVGKILAAPLPAKVRSSGTLGAWQFGMNAQSKHKELAWRFISMYASKKWMTKFADPTIAQPPSRQSVMLDPELLSKFPNYKVAAAALPNAVALPDIPEYQQVMDIVAAQLSAAATKKSSIDDALNAAATQMQDVLTKAGYVK